MGPGFLTFPEPGGVIRQNGVLIPHFSAFSRRRKEGAIGRFWAGDFFLYGFWHGKRWDRWPEGHYDVSPE